MKVKYWAKLHIFSSVKQSLTIRCPRDMYFSFSKKKKLINRTDEVDGVHGNMNSSLLV